ncbi:hypothetical protein BDP27DRAFT_1417353 [Rhodocollybia butyracea]|uniref:Uncharacterized protein n=1 Tax=Rhodocollybia butyracea TaxID=206335 RepID=A0A9P5UBL8_9AGAR|nr:hypothetical protein BDP27DRAFT_1417353 [Rhodocollybia butyracea]
MHSQKILPNCYSSSMAKFKASESTSAANHYRSPVSSAASQFNDASINPGPIHYSTGSDSEEEMVCRQTPLTEADLARARASLDEIHAGLDLSSYDDDSDSGFEERWGWTRRVAGSQSSSRSSSPVSQLGVERGLSQHPRGFSPNHFHADTEPMNGRESVKGPCSDVHCPKCTRWRNSADLPEKPSSVSSRGPERTEVIVGDWSYSLGLNEDPEKLERLGYLKSSLEDGKKVYRDTYEPL